MEGINTYPIRIWNTLYKVKMNLNIDSIDDESSSENMEYYNLYFYQILWKNRLKML